MFQQIFSIARNTFVESIRQPVYVVLVVCGTIALVLNLFMAANTLKDDQKLMIDMGYGTLFLTGWLLAAFTATGVLSQEIENKTVLTVVSKPVSRPLFVLGKFFGVIGAIGMAYWALSAVFLLNVRHEVMQTASNRPDLPVIIFGLGALFLAVVISALANYFYHWVFPSTFVGAMTILMTIAWCLVLVISKHWKFQSPLTDIQPQILLGLLLVFYALLILVAVALAASTRLGQVMTLLVCFGVSLIGLVNDGILGRKAEDAAWIAAIYYAIPNIQLLWPADAITQGHNFSASYIAFASGYSLLYTGAILAVAVALFQTREVG
jgi:hypothetical protein